MPSRLPTKRKKPASSWRTTVIAVVVPIALLALAIIAVTRSGGPAAQSGSREAGGGESRGASKNHLPVDAVGDEAPITPAESGSTSVDGLAANRQHSGASDVVLADTAVEASPPPVDAPSDDAPFMPSYRASATPSTNETRGSTRSRFAPRVESPSTASYSAYIVPAGRSPLPQIDEHFDKPLPPRRVGESAASPPPALASGTVVDWAEAQQHVGSHVVVQGKVVSVRRSGEVYFVNFHKDWQGKFYLVIFSDALSGFDQPPDKLLVGKTIQATGEIKTHRSTPQIQVHDAKQIKVVP